MRKARSRGGRHAANIWREGISLSQFTKAMLLMMVLTLGGMACIEINLQARLAGLEYTVEAVDQLQADVAKLKLAAEEPASGAEESEESMNIDYVYSPSVPLDEDEQIYIQAVCEEYSVPYALALAVAEVESGFDMSAKSPTGDHGMMQINERNFDALRGIGMEPETFEGNVEAGVWMLSSMLETFEGDTEAALMGYNAGATGARRMMAKGVQSTDYSRKVMDAYERYAAEMFEAR